jgi:membrane protein DedA with SNARE-associated domain
MLIPLWLQHDIELYGYWVVLVAVALESMGVPFPGETALLAGAIYAGTTDRMNIVGVIVAATVGAILGDNIGFSIGHFGGYPLLRRLTRVLRIEEKSLHYTQRYFSRHGDKTVFLGRFFSLLRTYVAFLAGVNRMPWRSFLFWNAFGGVVWATAYGLLGYVLGHNLPLLGSVLHVLGIGGIALLVVFVAVVIALWIVRRRRLKASLDLEPPFADPPVLPQPEPPKPRTRQRERAMRSRQQARRARRRVKAKKR